MRHRRRLAAAASAIIMAVAPTAAAAAPAVPAAPRPNPRLQWWFDSWAIQSKVWPLTQGAGVTVAVIDSGANARLPDLRGTVLKGLDLNGTRTDGRRDVDDTGYGHGTAMAGLITAQGRGTGLFGIAPRAKILPIIERGLGDPTFVRGLRFAADRGAKVINISLAASPGNRECPPAVQQAIIYAAQKDVVVVAAAGNTGDSHNVPEYPASCPGVVGVGAIDNRGRPWEQTQRQPYVVVAAPGSGIPVVGREGKIVHTAGTSNASALASGAFALVRSRFPDMPARRVVQLVTNTTVDLGPRGRDDLTGFGAISIRRALRHKVPANAPNPVYERLDRVLRTLAPTPPARGPQTSLPARRGTGSAVPALLSPAVIATGLVTAAVTAFLVVLRRRARRPNDPWHDGPRLHPSTPPPGAEPGEHLR
ncbi:S8 family serine peptidase [Thermomonospora umbrina]|uniref:Type VII secretion-associated serine protease mycosin n=1 Tax=Thermomonospora umbrina TaxID=111806 RepID=A0A3D9SX98_9ACTN|nr:S8 family serine peptidase [Thermomonospora umbrina]REF00469.1 type VII secretion-associated serine protease mycosin [Thermomonospora umbrina]